MSATRSKISEQAGSSAGIGLADLEDHLAGAPADSEVTIPTEFGDLVFSRSNPMKAERLMNNPRNNRKLGSKEKLMRMGERMDLVGLLNPLLVRPFQEGDPTDSKFFDAMIIAGHRRNHAIINFSKKIQEPACRMLKHPIPLPNELEELIFDVENEDRREDFENANQKKAWIDEKYGERIRKLKHGGNREYGKKSGGLAQEISDDSGGSISAGTAKRYIAELRKEYEEKQQSSKKKATQTRPPSSYQLAKTGLTEAAKSLLPLDEKYVLDELEKTKERLLKRLAKKSPD